MQGLYRIGAGMALAAMAATATAQSTNTLSDAGMRDSRFQAGIVVPFGGAGSKAERAPRLEAWSDHGWRNERAALRLRADRDADYGRPIRYGVTLGSQPRMMLNGREIPNQGDSHGVSTLGWVGIGVGVAVIAFGVVLAIHVKTMNN